MGLINKPINILKLAIPIILVMFFGIIVILSPEKITWVIDAFSPMIWAFVLAYLLDSFVRILNSKLKLKRTLGILIAYLCLLIIIVMTVSTLAPMLVENINGLVSFVSKNNFDINNIVDGLAANFDNEFVDMIVENMSEFNDEIQDAINSILAYLTNFLLNAVATVGASVLSVFTAIVLSIYMLLEKEDLMARMKRMLYAFFEERTADSILSVFSDANRIFKSYLVGKLLDSAIVGVITIIAFTLLGVPYAPVMGTIIGLFNIIPYFGPIIGAVPVVLITLFIDPVKAIVALIAIIVIGQIDANYVDPKIVGNNVGVSPFWIISSVVVAGAAFGPVGMILGVPSVVLVKTVIENVVNLKLMEKGKEGFEEENLKVMEVAKDSDKEENEKTNNN